jgi:hypothetical protein
VLKAQSVWFVSGATELEYPVLAVSRWNEGQSLLVGVSWEKAFPKRAENKIANARTGTIIAAAFLIYLYPPSCFEL